MRYDETGKVDHKREHLRLVRGIDGITYGLTALAAFFYFPSISETVIGSLSWFSILPLFAVAAATFLLPALENFRYSLRAHLQRMRFTVLCAAGLSPFLIWWVQLLNNLYLFVCTGLAVGMLIWFLIELTEFMRHLMSATARHRLSSEARVARILLTVAVFIPVMAVFAAFVIKTATDSQFDLYAVRSSWHYVPLVMRALLLIPPLMSLVVLWKCRFVLPHAAVQSIFSRS